MMFAAPMLAQVQGFPPPQQCGATAAVNACVTVQLIPQVLGLAARQVSVSILTADTQVAAYAVVVEFQLVGGGTLSLNGLVAASQEWGVATILNFPIHGSFPDKVTKFIVVRMYAQPADVLVGAQD
jgi:hypothetical protein